MVLSCLPSTVADARFRLIRPLARHPLLRTAALRERQDAERRAQQEEREGEAGSTVPPEIALVLAGPLASPPTAAHADAMAQLASLTLESPPKPRPPPSYIM